MVMMAPSPLRVTSGHFHAFTAKQMLLDITVGFSGSQIYMGSNLLTASPNSSERDGTERRKF